MKVYVVQVYPKAGANFPFSPVFQRWLGAELTAAASSRAEFERKYGPDFDLGVYVSADVGTTTTVIKGPTVFKKQRDVEYTVFLPYDVIGTSSDGLRTAMDLLVAGVHTVFERAGIDPGPLDARRSAIVEHVCSDATMLSKPWPTRA